MILQMNDGTTVEVKPLPPRFEHMYCLECKERIGGKQAGIIRRRQKLRGPDEISPFCCVQCLHDFKGRVVS